MATQKYSERLGELTDKQFQAALDRFELGKFLKAEPIPFGNFGQNVFVSSTRGEYVLRGCPHFWWQFPTEQFNVNQLHEHTQVPVPWPYLLDPAQDIFGWSYVLMPRMPGLQLADPEVRRQLGEDDRRKIAQALGENLAMLHEWTWPFPGRYDAATNTVQPFDISQEMAWPFPVESVDQPHATISYGERVVALLRDHLTQTQALNEHTTQEDADWVETLIARSQDALAIPFQPCYVMEDYQRSNVVVEQKEGIWRVSGVFDLMTGYFGDSEADLPRMAAMYLEEDAHLAPVFVQSYLSKKPPRPGFSERFPMYMLLDRIIVWEFFQRTHQIFWDERWTFRDWAAQYVDFTPR